MVGTDPNIILYTYDLSEGKFVKVGTVTKKYYSTEIEPKISFGSPEKEIGRDATIQKLFNLNGLQFVDVFEKFNNEVGIESDNLEKSKKFAEVLNLKTLQTGTRNTFANILCEGYNINKNVVVNSDLFHHVVIAEPLSKVTMQRSGKGELFLCFYSNGAKGKITDTGTEKGDVYLDNILYELKKNEGRLLPGIKIKPTKETLQTIVNETETNKQIDLIIDLIFKAAGSGIDDKYCLRSFIEMKLPDIIDILNYNLNSQFNNLYLKFLGTIIGIVSLIAYKNAHGFDRFILFELNKEVEFITFNFNEDLTVEQLFNVPGIKYKLDYTSSLGHQIDFI